MFSIYILTYNEAQDIAACIESALPCDDIIVVDSFSDDGTAAIVSELAQQAPVRLVQHAFESHGQQRSWMLREIPAKYDWAYILEADERMTPALYQECLERVRQAQASAEASTNASTNASSDHSYPIGFYVAERVMFMGRWIRHSTQYPRYQLRLLNRHRVWFSDYGHTEREVCDGPSGFLQETYPHYTSGKGLSRWIDKHNRYSSDEAMETLRQRATGSINWSDLVWGDNEVKRRHALKNLSQRIPLRPLVRFCYMYVFLGGFLDGRAGFRWCVLQMFYEYLIVLKVWEMEHRPYESVYGSSVAQGLTQDGIPRPAQAKDGLQATTSQASAAPPPSAPQRSSQKDSFDTKAPEFSSN